MKNLIKLILRSIIILGKYTFLGRGFIKRFLIKIIEYLSPKLDIPFNKPIFKTKIYKPSKTAMQSGIKKFDKWMIEFVTDDPGKNPLMGWESSSDTYSELNLEFKSKDLEIEYAKKNNISYEVIEPKERKVIKKSYAVNFID